MKKKFKHLYTLLLVLNTALLTNCKKDTPNTDTNTSKNLGWSSKDNPSVVPTFLQNFGTSTTALPTTYDLSNYLPPRRDQSPYGTCVAWSVGYHAKTILEAVSKNYTSIELASENNQISPSDLFTSIPSASKGAGCEGTQFAAACDVLQSRGAATFDIFPYSSLNCSGSSGAAANASASKHKILYYRKINQDVLTIKKQIANKIPVMFAAQIYSSFDNWNKNTVLSVNSGSSRGGHAMCIVGYDDNKGPSGAFKVVNSWGRGWGDNGFIWIDYNFFVNEFCSAGNLYIMANSEGSVTPLHPNSGVDVTPWVNSDLSTFSTSGVKNERKLNFNLYNIGTIDALPSANWEFHYIYYNAYNANDYGILFTDKFNTTVAANTYNCVTSTNCSFNYSISAGSDFADAVFGNNSINRTYKVPLSLSGTYYLVLFADATGALKEQNEQNNLFYTTGQNPITFSNGYAPKYSNNDSNANVNFINDLKPTITNLSHNKYNSAVNENHKNAYTPDEVMSFIKEKKRTGELDKKINQFKKS